MDTFRRIFLHAVRDKSVEGGLKSIRNTMTVRKNGLRKTGNSCRNSHIILSSFMQPCPEAYFPNFLVAVGFQKMLADLVLYSKSNIKRQALLVPNLPNLIQISVNNKFCSFALGSAHENFDVCHRHI